MAIYSKGPAAKLDQKLLGSPLSTATIWDSSRNLRDLFPECMTNEKRSAVNLPLGTTGSILSVVN